jgi:hypothetical protein
MLKGSQGEWSEEIRPAIPVIVKVLTNPYIKDRELHAVQQSLSCLAGIGTSPASLHLNVLNPNCSRVARGDSETYSGTY